MTLAPYAVQQTRGRRYAEAEHSYRGPYQRDRDRILYSAAFRRLMYKTQVLVNHASDHHRTRLTHSLEVAQVSRTLARELGLNEDLTEAIALAHDLGHPPFGHAGEAALNECLREEGGFEHNRQGLRIVEWLELRYPTFPGLNLTWEVRASLAYHSKRPNAEEIAEYRQAPQPFLEAQIVDAADSLVYDVHDLDDALTVRLIPFDLVRQQSFWPEIADRLHREHGPLPEEHVPSACIRRLIGWQVDDLVDATRRRISAAGVDSVEAVQHQSGWLVAPSPGMAKLKESLEAFLVTHVYDHYKVKRMAVKAKRFIQSLFQDYRRNPGMLPPRYRERIERFGLVNTIVDYLASMTDRYAQDEYLRLFHPFSPV